MIQRIQSLWLFLAAMIAGALFIFPLYHYQSFVTPLAPIVTDKWESVRNYLPLLIVGALFTLLPLVTIFFFGDRKKQGGMVWLSIIIGIGFIALMVMHAANLKNGVGSNLQWAVPGPVLPVISIIFLFLALRGIKKDEKLIKSLDRLR